MALIAIRKSDGNILISNGGNIDLNTFISMVVNMFNITIDEIEINENTQGAIEVFPPDSYQFVLGEKEFCSGSAELGPSG